MVSAWLLVMESAPTPDPEAIVDSVLVALLKVMALLPTSASL